MRFLLPAALVGLIAASTFGQGFNPPAPVQTPFAPRFVSPALPGAYGLGIRFGGLSLGFSGSLSYYGLPYYGVTYYVPYYGITQTPSMPLGPLTIDAPALQGAGDNGRTTIIPEVPAELTIEFPAPATVTLDGIVVPGNDATRVLKSPPLKVGQRHTFNVTARWTIGGQKFAWDRTVTLASGERGRVTVARGFPVKD